MLKGVIVAGALWGLAMPAMAGNVPEPERTEPFVVCSGCKTIFDRSVFPEGEPNPSDRASVDAALRKALGAAAVNAALSGQIVMGPGKRIQSLSLFGRRVLLATAVRQEDGSYAVARSNAVESLVSNWAAEVTTDKLHGSTAVVLSTLAEEHAGSLLLKCVDDKIDVVARWANDIGSASEQPVQWRIDDKPVVSETWPYTANGRFMASPRPVPLFKDLRDARKFVIRVRLHGGLDRTMVVSLAGLDEFLGTLRKACPW